ncbi:MAG: biotin/lipoyl-binding protein [Desulfobacteraceae bacterium]|nr:biotin/lipoyl-binding protein [Desulfobacteraceae bacterium]
MKERQKEMLKRGLIVVPVVCALIFVGVLKGLKKGPEKLPVKEAVRKVRTLEIQPMDVVPSVLGYGYVEPDKVWQVVPEVSGKVIGTSQVFSKGNFAGKGDLLITLDPTDYQLAVNQAEAEIKNIRARLTELDKNEQNTGRLLEIQQSLLALKKKELERNETARRTRAISESALDKARMNYQTQRILVQDLENALTLIPANRQALKAQLDLNLVKLAKARVDLDRTRIHVPFNCRITETRVEVGQFVQAGQILAKADGTERVEMTAQVSMEKMIRLFLSVDGSVTAKDIVFRDLIKMDMLRKMLDLKVKVRLVNDGFDTQWDADFARAGATIDPQTRTMGIIVVVEKPYEQIILGVRPPLVRNMFCEVEISGKPLSQRTVIPRSALHEDKVYVVGPESRLVRRPVRVEFAQGDFYVLKPGLDHGEQIVVSDLTPAIDGMLLEATEDKELQQRLITQAGSNSH